MIKASDLLTEVIRVGNENPDTTYYDKIADIPENDPLRSSCLYQYNDKPACIVGVALANMGVSVEKLSEFDDNDAMITQLVQHDSLFEPDDYEAIHKLGMIQEAQDSGYTWKDSIDLGSEEKLYEN